MTVHALPVAPDTPIPELVETESGEVYLRGHEWTDEQMRIAYAAYLASEWGGDYHDAYEGALRVQITRAYFAPVEGSDEDYMRCAAIDPGAEPWIEVVPL